MSLKSTVQSFFKTSSPGEQLAQAEAAIAQSTRQLETLRAQRPEVVYQKLLGATGAQARREGLDRAIAAEETRLRDLNDAAAAAKSHLMAEQAEIRRREAEAWPGRIAELRRQRRQQADQVAKAFVTLGETIQAMRRNASELAAQLGVPSGHGFLSPAAFRVRLQGSAARAFTMDPARPLTVANSLLGIGSSFVGHLAHATLVQHEEPALDDLVPFFVTEKEAKEAHDRLEARNTETMIVRLAGGVFTLVRAERVFGRQADAEAAAKRNPGLRVCAISGGFILLDDRVIGDEAA